MASAQGVANAIEQLGLRRAWRSGLTDPGGRTRPNRGDRRISDGWWLPALRKHPTRPDDSEAGGGRQAASSRDFESACRECDSVLSDRSRGPSSARRGRATSGVPPGFEGGVSYVFESRRPRSNQLARKWPNRVAKTRP